MGGGVFNGNDFGHIPMLDAWSMVMERVGLGGGGGGAGALLGWLRDMWPRTGDCKFVEAFVGRFRKGIAENLSTRRGS